MIRMTRPVPIDELDDDTRRDLAKVLYEHRRDLTRYPYYFGFVFEYRRELRAITAFMHWKMVQYRGKLLYVGSGNGAADRPFWIAFVGSDLGVISAIQLELPYH